jgi:triosephosphate isomerase
MSNTRRPIVAGNWKMNLNKASAVELARAVDAAANEHAETVDTAIFPAFVHLDACATAAGENARLTLGAQDVYFEGNGAFTGEVSLAMLKDLCVTAVLVGHSERRHVIGETDELCNKKVKAIIAAGLKCVLCIGETLEQREAGKTDAVNERQLRAGLEGVSAADAEHLVIAYEPVWAIGTGKTATPDDAQGAHKACRAVLADIFDEGTAQQIRILYGGSMKPGNAGELIAQPDIDGGLIGGASLKPDDFKSIIEAAAGVATA